MPVTCNDILSQGARLHDAGRLEEALNLYDSAMENCRDAVGLWNNRGNTLLALCRYGEAVESYNHALMLMPGLHDARVALATCLQALGHTDEALTACQAVLSQAPDHAEAHWNRALLLLLNGEYNEGWREYEWRWRKRGFTSPLRTFVQPRWQGEDIRGKTLLIHAEQGFGDTLQFCRYIPLLVEQGIRVVFECHPPLTALMGTLTDSIQVVPMGRPLPPFAWHIPLLSLPQVCNTTLDTIPARTPYLQVPPDRRPFWASVVPHDSRLRVGLCWAGKSYPDPNRSISPASLEPLSAIPNIHWFSLQIGPASSLPTPLPLTDLTSQILDFGDSAALVEHLDLVITIDTAVAHLAAALGKETWVMLPFAPDWRWLLVRDDSPWYPGMRLFRQALRGVWGGTVEQVARELGNVADHAQPH